MPFLISAIRFQGKSKRTDWHTVITYCISLVLSRFRTARVYEGLYAVFAAHLVHGGCIMCRIKDQSGNIPVCEERLDAGKSVQHGRKIMAGCTLQDREDRQSGVSIREEIEVIAIEKEISGGIPAPIGIWLGEPALMVAIVDALFMAIAHRMAALTVRNLHWSAVTGQNQFLDIQKIFVNRTGQEYPVVDFTDDVQFGHEDTSGAVSIKILDDGGSMIFVEGRRLFAIALSFRRFLPAVAQVRQEIVASWP